MKKLLLLLFSLLPQMVWAQAGKSAFPDSLQRVLATTKDQLIKLKTLEKLSKYFQPVNLDKAIGYENQGMALAQELKRDSDLCLLKLYAGETFAFKGDFKTSLKLLNEEIDLASQKNYKKYKSFGLMDEGLAYEMQGDYAGSLDNFLKCLRFAEQNNDAQTAGICNTNICVIYANQNNFDKTVEYANKVLQYTSKNKSINLETKAQEMLGNVYTEQGKYPTAQKYYTDALKTYTQAGNQMGIATMYTSLATTYPNNQQKQLELGLKAQAIWDKIAPENLYAINNLGGIGVAYGAMARNNITVKHLDSRSAETHGLLVRSETYLLKALGIATKTNSKQNIIELTDSLATIQALSGKYQQAYANLRAHNILSDSVFSQENKNKIASLEGKHEIELRDKQLEINKLELKDRQKLLWFLVGGLVTLALISVLIYNQSIQRKKNNLILASLNQQLDEANKVKTRFFSILNHDLRSPISNFVNILHLQQNAPDLMDDKAREGYTKKASASAENLLETMEDLLLWSKGQMENFKPDIKDIPVASLFEYIKGFTTPGRAVDIVFSSPPDMWLRTDEHYVKTIMHNLTNNAIKVLNDRPDGLIEWKAWEANGIKYLSISDNGPGATDGQLKALYDDSAPIGIKTGLGLHIVRDMAKAIGCKIVVHPGINVGVKIELRFG
jgi:signal transduction histidine kinase